MDIQEKAVVAALHQNWTPHSGQIPILRAVFKDKVPFTFVRCGRKFGKTEVLLYILSRWALTHPNAACYFIAPQYKQAKEILWANNRAQNFVPRPLIKKIDNQETRITFINDSFLKIDGGDNPDSLRGLTMDIVGLEEYREHDPIIISEIARPNLAPTNGPLIVIGTPPEGGVNDAGEKHHYQREEEEAAKAMDRGRGFAIHRPTHVNPHISEEWLDEEKARLISRGEEYVWKREYLAEYCMGGKNVIFPMFRRLRHADNTPAHFVPHEELMAEIKKDLSHLKFYMIADPGNKTVFAVLFICYNPYTGKVYVLDEIYQDDPNQTTVQRIWAHARKIMQGLHMPSGTNVDTNRIWQKFHDSAAAWWELELLNQFGVGSCPCPKFLGDKEEGLSMLKDMFLDYQLVFSSRCVKTAWEVENYKTDEHGRIPKRNDHTIDILRYWLLVTGYSYKTRSHRQPLPYLDELEYEREQYKNRHKTWADTIIDQY